MLLQIKTRNKLELRWSPWNYIMMTVKMH